MNAPGLRFVRTALFAMLVGGAVLGAADAPSGSFSTDFSKHPPGKPAGDDLFILNGTFAVTEVDGNKCLELPGNPLDTFGVLVGPEGLAATEVSARIFGTNVGKMFPEFGVGSNDSGGWKLWLLPAQNAVVLRFKNEEKARAPFTWTSGGWTHFKLRVAPGKDGAFAIEGKVWGADQKEPAAATVSITAKEPPPAGRASIWGQPYSGTPIRFDDLAVNPVK